VYAVHKPWLTLWAPSVLCEGDSARGGWRLRDFKGRDGLLQAVRAAALAAVTVAMEAELAVLRRRRCPVHFARASVRAVGTACLPCRSRRSSRACFAPGSSARIWRSATPIRTRRGRAGIDPFQLLGLALDRRVDAGVRTDARAGRCARQTRAPHGRERSVQPRARTPPAVSPKAA